MKPYREPTGGRSKVTRSRQKEQKRGETAVCEPDRGEMLLNQETLKMETYPIPFLMMILVCGLYNSLNRVMD